MFLNNNRTRLSYFLTELLQNLNRKILIVRNTFSLVLFSLFMGFICGNLFGTFLDTLRIYFFWNGFIGLTLLLFIETINFLVYGTKAISFSKRGNKSDSFQYNAIVKHNVSTSWLNQLTAIAKNLFLRKSKEKGFGENLHMPYLEKTINAFKIGLLFGFFVDSFKVGS